MPLFAFAQKDTEQLLKEGDEHFKFREYLNAINSYKQALRQDSANRKAQFQIGLSYLKSLNRVEALPYLLKVRNYDGNYHPLMDFYTAEAFLYAHQPEEAMKLYEATQGKYAKANQKTKITLINDEILVKDFLMLLYQRQNEARYGIHYLTDPTNATVRNLGTTVNSEYGDYAPVINANESVLIFTSRRSGTTGNKTDGTDNLPYEDIYITQKKKGEWTKPEVIDKNVNSKFHEASIALSADGNQLYVYKDDNGGDIYVTERKGKDNWTIPKNISTRINSKYREPSASITPDGKTMYFASNRPGGLGGLDIYKAVKDDKGNWSEGVNLGEKVNTPEDEDCPFIHFDTKTLYFSSRGHQSMGGFDIFYTEYLNDQWVKPINLGYPINTADDDIHFVLSANYKRGYYASAQREGYGDKDIYIVDMPDYKDVEVIDFQLSIKTINVDFNPLITNDPRRAVVILRGVVRDEVSDELISAKMSLIDIEDNHVLEEISAISPKGVYYTTMQTGRRYLLHVQKEGYLYHSEYFEIPVGVVNQEKILHIYLKRINLTKTLDFKALYDYNSATLKRISEPALEKLRAFLTENPSLKGEIAGHTDNIGSTDRNQSLSQQRAKSVFEWLIAHGIDKDRITYAGYGFDQPIATNDTPHGRSLNRRTEFKILTIQTP
jgi:outer membrane protein OmpA-like peptidoglycan-associated protein/tetratricopeptide (TPR) repeat protein